MAKFARLPHLFEGNRRQCTLTDYRPLKSKSKEKRMKLLITSSLTSQPFDGMPEEFSEEFYLMKKDKSATNFKKVNVEMENALFSVFATDTSGLYWKAHSATINGFKLIAAGIDHTRTVDLEFTVFVPWSETLRQWLDETLHEDFFLEVIPAQQELEAETAAEKPVGKKKGKGKSKSLEFDPAALQKAAKDGEYREPVN